jgi:hypothetical protein
MPPKDKNESQIPPYDNDTGLSMADMDNWVPSDGSQNVGTATTSATVDSMDPSGAGMEFDMSYNFNEMDGQMSFDYEGDLRKKYPALKQAYEHYQNIKQMCETREKEEDEN